MWGVGYIIYIYGYNGVVVCTPYINIRCTVGIEYSYSIIYRVGGAVVRCTYTVTIIII